MEVLGKSGTNQIVAAIKQLRPNTQFSSTSSNDGIYRLLARWATDVKKFVIVGSSNTPDAIVTLYKKGAVIYPIGCVNCLIDNHQLNNDGSLKTTDVSEILSSLQRVPEAPTEITSVDL